MINSALSCIVPPFLYNFIQIQVTSIPAIRSVNAAAGGKPESPRFLLIMRRTSMKTANFIDRHVGSRLRSLRQTRGVEPDALARLVAISPGRLDDLEQGRERISAELLRRLSRALEAPPAEFFEGFSVTAQGLVRLNGDDVKAAGDEERLLRDFARIRDKDTRQLVLALVSSYAAFEGMAKG